MHSSEASPSRRSFFQLSLGSALFLLLAIGLGLGWWSDHTRLAKELADSEIERNIQERQIVILKTSRASLAAPRLRSFSYTANSPEHFIELIREVQTAANASDWGESLRKAKEDFDPSVQTLIALLSDPEERIRRNACLVLEQQYTAGNRDRMKKHHSELMSQVSRVLKHSQPAGTDTHQAIQLLGAIGTEAESAVSVLDPIVREDQHPQAVFATIALGKLRPSIDVSPRLIELIQAKNVAWESAVLSLRDYRSADEVRVFLNDLYFSKKTDTEREEVAGIMLRAGL